MAMVLVQEFEKMSREEQVKLAKENYQSLASVRAMCAKHMPLLARCDDDQWLELAAGLYAMGCSLVSKVTYSEEMKGEL